MRPEVRVLYAEDNPADADQLRARLAADAPELRLEVVDSGEQCLRRLAEAPFDLLLLDLHLPDTDGPSLLGEVRKAGHTLPAVAVSSWGDDQLVVRALRQGANTSLSKRGDGLGSAGAVLREVVAAKARPPLGAPTLRRVLCVELSELPQTRASLADAAPHLVLEVAATFEEASARLATPGAFDAVLVDLRPPTQRGLDFLSRARAAWPMTLPPVVFTGAGLDEGVALSALRLGAADVLPAQPGALAQLPARLEVAIARHAEQLLTQQLRAELAERGRSQAELLKTKVELERQNADLTRVQAELAATSARYEDLYRQAPVGYCTLDAAGCVVMANLAAAGLLGLSPQALQGRPLRGALHPDDQPAFDALVARLAEGGGEPQSGEWRLARPGPEPSWVQVTLSSVPGSRAAEAASPRSPAAGPGETVPGSRAAEAASPRSPAAGPGETVPGSRAAEAAGGASTAPALRAVLLDVTDRRRAEADRAALREQLHQAQKLDSIGRLAGGVAHDFNNMLAAILGSAELLHAELSPSHPLQEPVGEILSAARRSAELTRRLLAFARRQTVAPRSLDLNETVAGMLGMLRRLIGEAITLDWHPQPELWPVCVDPSQVDQLLANLCVNARDAIGGAGTIRIETRTCSLGPTDLEGRLAGDYVQLVVGDDGCGMSEAVLDHLFEPFFTTKAPGAGTGLGLSIVYGIVQQARGFLDVDSAPGEGATFTIWFPRDTVTPVQPTPAATDAPGGHETVLLVEDEGAVLRLTARQLRVLGYRVLEASRPSQALAVARAEARPIALLLSDVIMPEMNGRQLASTLAREQPGLRCVFISGYTDEVLGAGAILEPGVHFLQKPFSRADLARAVRAALDTPTPAPPAGG